MKGERMTDERVNGGSMRQSSSFILHPSGRDAGDKNRGAEFGMHEPGTAGTNRDADERGVSRNQGHGHRREERNRRGE